MMVCGSVVSSEALAGAVSGVESRACHDHGLDFARRSAVGIGRNLLGDGGRCQKAEPRARKARVAEPK